MRQLPLIVVLSLAGGLLFWNFSFYGRNQTPGPFAQAAVHAAPAMPNGSQPVARLEDSPLRAAQDEMELEAAARSSAERASPAPPKVEVPFATDEPTGLALPIEHLVIEHYSNGGVEWRGSMRGGVRHGAWIEWYADGTEKSRGEYLDGLRVGDWVFYHPNGEVSHSGRYAIVSMSDLGDLWHGDGALPDASTYERDVRDGLWHVWHTNGQIKEAGTYAMGLREGEWQFYDYHGHLNPLRSGTYVQGEKQ